MKHTRFLAGAAAVLLVCSGGVRAQDSTAAGNESLAKVGDRTISRAEFEREMERRGAGLPGQYATPEQRRALLDELIRREALTLQAYAAGYDRDPDVLAALERIIISRFTEDRLAPRIDAIEVTDEEVERFYRENSRDYMRPARIQIALVQIAVPEKAADEKRAEYRARAEAALLEAEEQASTVRHFGSVARTYSDDRATRYKGGVIGWLTADSRQHYKWDTAALDAAFALEEPGSIAPLVEGADGFYLVRLVRREAAQARPLAALKDGLRYQLIKAREDEVRQAFLEELLSGLEIEVSESLLQIIEPSEPAIGGDKLPPPLPGG